MTTECYCLCVQEGGRWRRVVTVAGRDPAGAYALAVAVLPPSLSHLPVQFRASEMCPCDAPSN